MIIVDIAKWAHTKQRLCTTEVMLYYSARKINLKQAIAYSRVLAVASIGDADCERTSLNNEFGLDQKIYVIFLGLVM